MSVQTPIFTSLWHWLYVYFVWKCLWGRFFDVNIATHLANPYLKPQSLIHLSLETLLDRNFCSPRPLSPSSRTNVQVIQLPCVKNAILLFCFFSLQFRRHTIDCRLSSTCYDPYRNTYFRLLHHSYHLSSVSFPRRCPSTSIKKVGEWSFKLRRPNVQRRPRPPIVIYPTTTSRLLPLVASNIRVMTSFDAVMRRRRTVPFIPRKAPRLHQQCHVMFIYSSSRGGHSPCLPEQRCFWLKIS